MRTTEILRSIVRALTVEIVKGKGGTAFIFVNDEYAGSVERDEALGTWGAYSLFTTGDIQTSEGMWGAIDAIVADHIDTSLKAALAR